MRDAVGGLLQQRGIWGSNMGWGPGPEPDSSMLLLSLGSWKAAEPIHVKCF